MLFIKEKQIRDERSVVLLPVPNSFLKTQKNYVQYLEENSWGAKSKERPSTTETFIMFRS